MQRLRPEISAALAAVVERATAKETEHRYQTVGEMVHDLEEVLAIEAARTGEATGEATTVLRTLSDDTADFAPVRLRHPKRVIFLTLLLLALVGRGGLVPRLAHGEGAGRGTGGGRAARARARRARERRGERLRPGGRRRRGVARGGEPRARRASGTPPGTRRPTRRASRAPNKRGVGLYVDAGRPIPARRLSLLTSTPGFEAAVYASNTVPRLAQGLATR